MQLLNGNSTGDVSLTFDTISSIISLANLVLAVLEVHAHGFGLLLNFTLSLQIWCSLIASISILTFNIGYLLDGPEHYTDSIWEAAAVGVLSAWFSAGFNLQLLYFLNVGTYITMVISTIRLIFIVIATLFLFFLGFAYAFYILVGTVMGLQYGSIGESLFSTFHSLIATTDFSEFVNQGKSGGLRFLWVVFFFLVLLILFLPILFINLLIGLTIGDISRIQKDAIITRLAIEVHAITSLNLRCNRRPRNADVDTKHYRKYPNKNTFYACVKNLFNSWLSTKSGVSDGKDDEDEADDDFKTALKEEFAEYKEFQEQSFNKLHQRIDYLTSSETAQMDKLKQLEDKLEAKIKHLEDLITSKR